MKNLTPTEIALLLLLVAKERDNSDALHKVPGQRWKDAHESNYQQMSVIHDKLIAMQISTATEEDTEHEKD